MPAHPVTSVAAIQSGGVVASPTSAPVIASATTAGNGVAAAQSVEACVPAVLGVIAPALPEAIFVQLQESGRDRAIDRDYGQLFSVLSGLAVQLAPVIVAQIQQMTQQRDADGSSEDEVERFLPALLGTLAPLVIQQLPAIIAQVTGQASRSVRVSDREMAQRWLGPILSAVATVVAGQLPGLIAAVQGGHAGARRDTVRTSRGWFEPFFLSWHDLRETNRLQDGDVIHVGFEDIAPGTTEFRLVVPGHMRWWKGVEIEGANRGSLVWLETQDDTKEASHTLETRLVQDPGGYLLFAKAKAFGVHTGMYLLPVADMPVNGKRVTFYWDYD